MHRLPVPVERKSLRRGQAARDAASAAVKGVDQAHSEDAKLIRAVLLVQLVLVAVSLIHVGKWVDSVAEAIASYQLATTEALASNMLVEPLTLPVLDASGADLQPVLASLTLTPDPQAAPVLLIDAVAQAYEALLARGYTYSEIRVPLNSRMLGGQGVVVLQRSEMSPALYKSIEDDAKPALFEPKEITDERAHHRELIAARCPQAALGVTLTLRFAKRQPAGVTLPTDTEIKLRKGMATWQLQSFYTDRDVPWSEVASLDRTYHFTRMPVPTPELPLRCDAATEVVFTMARAHDHFVGGTARHDIEHTVVHRWHVGDRPESVLVNASALNDSLRAKTYLRDGKVKVVEGVELSWLNAIVYMPLASTAVAIYLSALFRRMVMRSGLTDAPAQALFRVRHVEPRRISVLDGWPLRTLESLCKNAAVVVALSAPLVTAGLTLSTLFRVAFLIAGQTDFVDYLSTTFWPVTYWDWNMGILGGILLLVFVLTIHPLLVVYRPRLSG